MVTGERDCLVGAASRATVAEVATAAVEVVVVPGADHYVRQSDPAAFHAVVDPWLASRTGTAAVADGPEARPPRPG